MAVDQDTVGLLTRLIDQQTNHFDRRLEDLGSMVEEARDHAAATNGNLARAQLEINDLKLWRAQLQGGAKMLSWVPMALVAAVGSGAGVLIGILVAGH